MSEPDCTSVCEIIISWLKSLGFKINDDPDHTDVIDALSHCNLIKDQTCEDSTVIMIDVLQFMQDNLEWALPSGSKEKVELANMFKEHLEEGLTAWIEDEFESFKDKGSD